MDVFQELELEESLKIHKDYVETFLKEVNSMYQPSAIQLDPVPVGSNKWYRKPNQKNQKEAAQMWDQCGFLGKASESMIESGLWEWALTYANVQEKGDTFQVEWSSPTTNHSASWSAFFRWFLCTCGPPL